MDPSGPWAYTYNRIAVTGASTSATTSSNDFQHHNLTTIAGQTVSSTSPTSTILFQTSNASGNSTNSFSPGFISSTSTAYEQVFNPIFQHSAPKSTHYNSSLNSSRQNLNTIQVTVSAPEKSDSPRQNFSNHGQQQNFYTEQTASEASPSSTTNVVSGTTLTWQGNNTSHVTIGDPFSLLSQENVVQAASSNSSGQQSNYTSHYQSPQPHISQIKISPRSSSPQMGGTKTTIQSVPSPITTVSVAASSGMQTSTQYYRQPTSISTSYSDSSAQTSNIINSNKSLSAINPSSLNQACILVTTTPAVQAATNQNVTNQKYVKKQNMYNNAARNNIVKNSVVPATITPANLIANTVNNDGSSSTFGIPTSAVKSNNHTLHLVQTKAQAKIYPELVLVDEHDRAKLAEIQADDGSISYYTIIDGRLAYTSGNANLIINESAKGRTITSVQSPRQFVLSNSAEIIAPDGSRIKTEPNYAGSPLQNECTNTIIVPRKQSPSHSGSSQTPSPAYPIYNSPMNSLESPSQHSGSSGTTHSTENSGHIVIYKSNTPNQAQMSTQSTLDTSVVSRNVANNSLTNTSSPVVYSSVITRALVNEQGKVYSSQQTCWDNDIKPKKYYTINSGSQNEIVVPAEIQLKPAYYETVGNNTQIGALHCLKTEVPQVTESILVTTDNPLASQIQITPKIEEQPPPQRAQPPPQPVQPPTQPTQPAKSRRRRNQNSTKTREQLLSENEFLVNRVPPPAHNTKSNSTSYEIPCNLNLQPIQQTQSLTQQQQNGGTYYEHRWNSHQNVPQQVLITGSSSQIANYGDQQQITQHQQQHHQQHQRQSQQQHEQQSQHQQRPQQQQQQVLLTHQQSHHAQYPSQTSYYTDFHVSSNVSGQTTPTQQHSITEAPVNASEPRQVQNTEPGQQIIAQLTQTPDKSEAGKNTSASIKQEESNHDEESGLKVVVPNIEEELGFLSSDPVQFEKVNKAKNTTGIIPVLKFSPHGSEQGVGKTFKVPNSATTGFMASYLKFLQGERDSSPPPLGRAQRKTIFQKINSVTPVVSSVQIAASKSSTLNTPPVYKTSQQKAASTVTNITTSISQAATSTHQNPVQGPVLNPDQQLQQKTMIQQMASVTAQTSNSLATTISTPVSTSTITTNYAATQTVNKKRKAVTEIESEQSKQRKNNNKPKNVAEIAVQTASHPVMLPKKARPQMAMQMASMQQQIKTINTVPSDPQLPQTPIKQQVQSITTSTMQAHTAIQAAPTYRHQPQQKEEDPLNLPPRRETSLRKAKTRGIKEIMQKKFENDDPDEPHEFADSDTDPVWTPQDEENELNKTGKVTKRKSKRPKTSYSRSRKACSNILTAAVMDAGIDDSDADNVNNDGSKRMGDSQGVAKQKQINSPKGMKQEAIRAQESSPVIINTIIAVEEFKVGDYVILRSDLIKDWPVLWQVDGKSILQMFEPFCKDGKILYKNMSKYAAWNNESRRLYVRAPISIRSQSQNETEVELNKSQLYGSGIEQFAKQCLNDYLVYRENFDVYVQTLISQSLDPNFFIEITKEKDDYFLSNVKIIEDIMENCKRKLLLLTHMAKNIIVSIETWPHYNVITDIGHNNINQVFCGGCSHPGAAARFLLYGQPYRFTTLTPVEPDPNINYERDILFCQSCESRAELLHKVVHEKYNLYQICSRKVQDQQIIDPTKGTTAILNDLLADSDWIDQLFSNVRNSWAEVETLERIVRFYQVSQ